MDEILNLTESDLNAMTARELYKVAQIVKLKNLSLIHM
jgi:hypothetical protein